VILSSCLFTSCQTEFEEEEDTSEAYYDVKVDDISYYEKFRDQKITLNVYNWGEYISNGSEGSLDVIAAFEKITGINVNYTNYATNEDMYAKFKNGDQTDDYCVYDIIIPSDYMIDKMIDENMLEKINFDNIPNIKYIADQYRYTDFDPDGEYSVPYTWGTVGIIYNKKHVDPEDAKSWDILWNEKYKSQVLMFSNSKDAFAIALSKLGYSMNTEDPEELEEATVLLREQRSVIQTYVMDQIFDKMQLEEAYVAPYYAGDAVTMIDGNPNLAFSHSKEKFNLFIDSLCIPKGSRNKEAAEAFINFVCETEVAVANCEYICYSTPHTLAREIILESMEEWQKDISYPDPAILENTESFIALSPDTNEKLVQTWSDVLIGINEDSWQSKAIVPVVIIIGLGLVILIILMKIRRNKKRMNY
jgi:spermidine/putrescine transport system substrate-binding protein